MKVYITKWALAKGILVADAEPDSKSKEHVVVRGAVPWQDFRFGLGDWHVDRDKALKRAGQMQDAKLKALEAQRTRVANLDFNPPDLV